MYALINATNSRTGGEKVQQATYDGNKMNAEGKRPFKSSTIFEKVASSGNWERTAHCSEGYQKGHVIITGIQFTGGRGTSKEGVLGRTLQLGQKLMKHLSITDHNVMEKLLEMQHWHSLKHKRHQYMGIYWYQLDRNLSLPSLDEDDIKATANLGLKWIKSN